MKQISRHFLAYAAGLACLSFSANAWANEWSYTVTTDSSGKVSVSGPRGGSATGEFIKRDGYVVEMTLPASRAPLYTSASGNPNVAVDDNSDHRGMTEAQRGMPFPDQHFVYRIERNASKNTVKLWVTFINPKKLENQMIKKFTIKQPFKKNTLHM